MTVSSLYRYLDDRIPSSLSADWDNDGLMCCPDGDRRVKKVLLSLDVTGEAADYAVKNGFDVILTHHPLIFSPLRSVTDPKLITLIREGIAVMSFHTRLDALAGGVNDRLCAILGILHPVSFTEDGICRMGDLPSPLSLTDFAMQVKNSLNAPFLQILDGSRPCSRIALCGGEGKDDLPAAVSAGCDTYLTGNINYNALLDAAAYGINIITAGHFYTENPVLAVLEDMLKSFDSHIVCETYHCNRIITLV